MKLVLPEKNSQHAQEIEEAVVFLLTRMLESGHNPKPVIFPSVRVGVYLYNFSYEPDIVKAGILQDVIEDSDTALAEVACTVRTWKGLLQSPVVETDSQVPWAYY